MAILQKKHSHLGSGTRKRKGDWWLILVVDISIFQNQFSAGEPSRLFQAAILILKPARAFCIHIQRSKFPVNQVKRATWTKSTLNVAPCFVHLNFEKSAQYCSLTGGKLER